MARELILITGYGLCNRLICIATWRAVADAVGRRFRFSWPGDAEVCNTGFSQLFENPEQIVSRQELVDLKETGNFLAMKFYFGFRDDAEKYQQKLLDSIPGMVQESLLVSMSCYFVPGFVEPGAFHRAIRSNLLDFQPNNGISGRVDAFCAEHGMDPEDSNLIGVHIRRTDGQRTPYLSTDEQFVSAMDANLEVYPGTRFFLATDAPDIRDMLKKRYGDRMIIADHDFGQYGTRTTSAEDALVDLYLLARTNRILGSFGSSYSKVASLMRGCTFYQVGFG